MIVPGTLFVIAAPSGAGKTTLVHSLIEKVPDLTVSISHTTRAPRSNEEDGVHYHFVDEKTFKSMIEENQFIEHAKVFSRYYGTSSQWVKEQLESGKDVILEIDWQGAEQVRRLIVHCVSIFILPPSREILQERLLGRASDNEAEINKRMALASLEISKYQSFDYMVVNDQFEQAVLDLEFIIYSQRLLRSRQEIRYGQLLKELLA